MDESEINLDVIIVEISKLNLKTNDALLIKIPDKVFNKISCLLSQQNLKKVLPNIKILLLPSSFEVSVVESEGLKI